MNEQNDVQLTSAHAWPSSYMSKQFSSQLYTYNVLSCKNLEQYITSYNNFHEKFLLFMIIDQLNSD